VEDRAVDQVIALQEGTGIEVVTDGEMRRFLFMGPITETVEGIELVEPAVVLSRSRTLRVRHAPCVLGWLDFRSPNVTELPTESTKY
jgi:methionine synthase II (cobalamin-independent)